MKFLKIKDYPYQVSDCGQILSTRSGKLMKLSLSTHGYPRVGFTVNGFSKFFDVHRLVAKAFIPNPENKRTVNHIDGDKTNNNVSNLEWNTHSENHLHAYEYLGRTKQPLFNEENGMSKPVNKLTKDGIFIKRYPSAREACRDTENVNPQNIGKVCKKTRNSTGGFKWEYAT